MFIYYYYKTIWLKENDNISTCAMWSINDRLHLLETGKILNKIRTYSIPVTTSRCRILRNFGEKKHRSYLGYSHFQKLNRRSLLLVALELSALPFSPVHWGEFSNPPHIYAPLSFRNKFLLAPFRFLFAPVRASGILLLAVRPCSSCFRRFSDHSKETYLTKHELKLSFLRPSNYFGVEIISGCVYDRWKGQREQEVVVSLRGGFISESDRNISEIYTDWSDAWRILDF